MQTEKQKRIKTAMKPVMCSRLRKYRTENHMSQEEMARLFMISVRSYVDLEHGESLPSALTLALFLTRLDKEEQKGLLNDLRREIEKGK